MSSINLATAFWFLTAVIIVSFLVHILCHDRKLKAENEISKERVSKMFYNTVTRKFKKAKSKNVTVLEAFTLTCAAQGALEAFERFYGDISSLISSPENELTRDQMSNSISEFEDFLRTQIV